MPVVKLTKTLIYSDLNGLNTILNGIEPFFHVPAASDYLHFYPFFCIGGSLGDSFGGSNQNEMFLVVVHLGVQIQ